MPPVRRDQFTLKRENRRKDGRKGGEGEKEKMGEKKEEEKKKNRGKDGRRGGRGKIRRKSREVGRAREEQRGTGARAEEAAAAPVPTHLWGPPAVAG